MTVDDDDDDDDDDDCDVNDGVCVFVCLDDTEATDDRQTERERETGRQAALLSCSSIIPRVTDGQTDIVQTLHCMRIRHSPHTHTLCVVSCSVLTSSTSRTYEQPVHSRSLVADMTYHVSGAMTTRVLRMNLSILHGSYVNILSL